MEVLDTSVDQEGHISGHNEGNYAAITPETPDEKPKPLPHIKRDSGRIWGIDLIYVPKEELMGPDGDAGMFPGHVPNNSFGQVTEKFEENKPKSRLIAFLIIFLLILGAIFCLVVIAIILAIIFGLGLGSSVPVAIPPLVTVFSSAVPSIFGAPPVADVSASFGTFGQSVTVFGTNLAMVDGFRPSLLIDGVNTTFTLYNCTRQSTRLETCTMISFKMDRPAYLIEYTNPFPLSDTKYQMKTLFTFVSAPSLTSLVPNLAFCTSPPISNVVLTGENLIKIGSQYPKISLGGLDLVVSPSTQCPTDLGNQAFLCPSLTFDVPAGLDLNQPLLVTIPPPLNSYKTSKVMFQQSSAPHNLLFTPNRFCANVATKRITLTGQNLFRVDNKYPSINIVGTNTSIVSGSCTNLAGSSYFPGVIAKCDSIEFDVTGLVGNTQGNLTLSTPESYCPMNMSPFETIESPNIIATSANKFSCSFVPTIIEITGTNLIRVGTDLPTLFIGSDNVNVVDAVCETQVYQNVSLCSKLSIEILSSFNLVADWKVTNPAPYNECPTILSSFFTYIEQPNITVDKPSFCRASEHTFTLSGINMLQINGSRPNITIQGNQFASVDAVCNTPVGFVPVSKGDYFFCSNVTYAIPSNAFANDGFISLTNPIPFACPETVDLFFTIPPPTIATMSPNLLHCNDSQVVTITGTNLIKSNGQFPTFLIGSTQITVIEGSCTTLLRSGVYECSSVILDIPAGLNVSQDIAITNPAPFNGCPTIFTSLIKRLSIPNNLTVNTNTLCGQVSNDIVIDGSGLYQVDTAFPSITIGSTVIQGNGMSCQDVIGTPFFAGILKECASVTFTIPAELSNGVTTFHVSNPVPISSCKSTTVDVLIITRPDIYKIEPNILSCNLKNSTVSLFGHAVQFGSQLPTFTLSGETLRIIGSECGQPLGYNTWNCSRFDLEIPSGLNVTADIHVTNPVPFGGCTNSRESALYVIGKPSLIQVDRPSYCSERNWTITITAQGMLRVGSALPTIEVYGQVLQATSGSCVDPVQGNHTHASLDYCTSVTFDVAPRTFSSVNSSTLILSNPAPYDGCSTIYSDMTVLDPPHVDLIRPNIFLCPRVDMNVSLTGSNMFMVDNVKPRVFAGSVELVALDTSNCTKFVRSNIMECITIDVTITTNIDLSSPIKVINPTPFASCDREFASDFVQLSPVQNVTLSRNKLCSNEDLILTLTGQGLYQFDSNFPSIEFSTGVVTTSSLDCIILNGTTSFPGIIRECQNLTLAVPPHLVDNAFATIKNPTPLDGCPLRDQFFVVTIGPELISIIPNVLSCNHQNTTVQIHVHHTLRNGNELPKISLAGLDLEILSHDCTILIRDNVYNCSTFDVLLPSGANINGSLTITNPTPFQNCAEQHFSDFKILQAPSNLVVAQSRYCSSEVRDVILSGSGLFMIDDVMPSLKINEKIINATIGACTVPVVGDYRQIASSMFECSNLTYKIPVNTFFGKNSSLVTIINPGEMGACPVSQNLFLVLHQPIISTILPNSFPCNTISNVTISGSNFYQVDGVYPSILLENTTLQVIDATCVETSHSGIFHCTSLMIQIDASLFISGNITISNPGAYQGCPTVSEPFFKVLSSPSNTFVVPSSFCSSDVTILTVMGQDMFSMDETYFPTLEFGSRTLNATTADCQDIVSGNHSFAGVVRSCLSISYTFSPSLDGNDSISKLINGSGTIQNPAPLNRCSTVLSNRFNILPSPIIQHLSPLYLTCPSLLAGKFNLTIRGDNFYIFNKTLPIVIINEEPVTNFQILDCIAESELAMRCQRIIVELVNNQTFTVSISLGTSFQGCNRTVVAQISYQPIPSITFLSPSTLVKELIPGSTHVLSLHGTNLNQSLSVHVDGLVRYQAISIFSYNDSYAEAVFTNNIEFGNYPLFVRTIDGCGNASQEISYTPYSEILSVAPQSVIAGVAMPLSVYTYGPVSSPVTVFQGATSYVLIANQSLSNSQVWEVLLPPLTGGVWSVTMNGLSPRNFTVGTSIGITSITVPNGRVAVGEATQLSLTAFGMNIGARAFLYLGTTGIPNIALESVVISGNNMSFVVPSTISTGIYSILIVNPDGTYGFRTLVITVLPNPKIILTSITPNSIPSVSTVITLLGENIQTGVSLSISCVAAGVTTSASLVVASSTATTISTTVNGAAFTIGSLCTFTATNPDLVSYTFGSMQIFDVLTTGDLGRPWTALPSMNTDRAAHCLVSYKYKREPIVRVYYAIGGHNGAGPASGHTSIEILSLNEFGSAIGTWQFTRSTLPVATSSMGCSIIGGYIYMYGGSTPTGVTSNTWRAQILDTNVIPSVSGDILINPFNPANNMTSGVWYYKVSAVYPSNYEYNPNGESLPSNVFSIILPNCGGVSLRLSWKTIPFATGYRVYRIAQPNQPLGLFELIANTTSTNFTDIGNATVVNIQPFAPYQLGNWFELPISLNTSRESSGWGGTHFNSSLGFLYATGGRNSASAYLSSSEYMSIQIGPPLSSVHPETHRLSTWGTSNHTIPIPLADHALTFMTREDMPGVPAGQLWFYLVNGRTTGNAQTSNVYANQILSNGGYESAFSLNPIRTNDAGPCYGCLGFISQNYLTMMGGVNDLNIPPVRSQYDKGQICTATQGLVCTKVPAQIFNAAAGWKVGSVNMMTPRTQYGMATQSSFVVVAGGRTQTLAASKIVEINQK